MMLVRATRDLPADTEITWWYDPPPTAPTAYLERQRLLRKNWGFMCKCGICREMRDTPGRVLNARKALLKEVRELVGTQRSIVGMKSLRKAEKAVAKWAATHKLRPGEAPWLGVSNLQLMLASRYRTCGEPVESVKMAMEALRSLGYVIDGGDVREGGQPPVVKEWGLMADHAIDCWMFVLGVSQLAAPWWVDTVEKYAKTTYRMCWGEDETFEKMSGGGKWA